MNEYTPSAKFEDLLSQAVAPPAAEAVFVQQLRSRLLEEAHTIAPKTRRFSPRLAWGLAMGLILLIITLLATSPTAVEAMKRIFGYLPGVGIVEQNVPLRTLAEPVTVERDGITLTVLQALVSPEETVLTYQVENIPEAALAKDFREGETPPPACAMNDSLRLPDGALLFLTGGRGSGWQLGYQFRETFDPVPAGVDQVTLLISCLAETAPGKAPENWEIPLTFVTAPPDITLVPIIEITPLPPTATPPIEPSEAGAADVPATGETPLASSDESGDLAATPLTLERYIELEDGYILIGSINSITLTNGLVTSPYAPWGVHFIDANGQEILIDYVDDVDLPAYSPHSAPWAHKIQGKSQAWPITIQIERLDAMLPDVSAAIEFDTGPDPQAGQEWVLDQDVQLGIYSLRVLTVTRTLNGYAFSLQGDPEIQQVGISIQSQGEPTQPSGGGGGGWEGQLSLSLAYADQVPEGVLTLEISSVVVLVPGPWSVQWIPENFPESQAPPTPVSLDACFTDKTWAQARSNPTEALPAGLSGKFILFGPNADETSWGVHALNLADNSRAFLGQGSWPIASPDGSKVVFTGDDGLIVYDFTTSETLILPGTDPSDYRMVWSPDGSRIAFVRSSADQILVIDADGSNQQQARDNSAVYHALVGWVDNQHLIVTEPGPEGVNLQALNLADGSTQNLFPVSSNKADLVLSPDNQWIAFTNSLGGSQGNGLYISRLDGSERRMIGNLHGRALYFPIWSPDSRWLIVSLPNSDDLADQMRQALIQLDTCQIIPLPNLDGEVYSWGL